MTTRVGLTLSRRAFLRLSLLAAIAAGVGVIYRSTERTGFYHWFLWTMRGNLTRLFGPQAQVGLAACSGYEQDVLASLREAWQAAGAPDLSGKRVVLKPNLVDVLGDLPSYTHPNLVEAAVQLARDMGAQQVIVADGPAFRRDARAILNATGYTEMLTRNQVDFVDLNYDDVVSVPLRGSYVSAQAILLPKTVAAADWLISLPKLKTHHWTLISGSAKNLFGIVPGIKYGWPKNSLHIQGIPLSIAALLDSIPTRVCAIVDGIVGMEGDGPLFGNAVPTGWIGVGTDLLAVDATCARLMGFDPRRVDYLNFGALAGLGQIDENKVKVAGESMTQLRREFARPPIAG